MGAFRWLLLAAGILVLAAVFWWSRREAAGRRFETPAILRRRAPSLTAAAEQSIAADRPDIPSISPPEPVVPRKIIAVRLTAPGNGTFAGEALQAAMLDAGLRHGLYGIFHRHDPADDRVIRFSVASLIEPGKFDPARFATDRFPGITLFFPVSPGSDNLAAFDDMLATARKIAGRLEGELLDERGSRLSVQRERYLREEVIQMNRQFVAAS